VDFIINQQGQSVNHRHSSLPRSPLGPLHFTTSSLFAFAFVFASYTLRLSTECRTIVCLQFNCRTSSVQCSPGSLRYITHFYLDAHSIRRPVPGSTATTHLFVYLRSLPCLCIQKDKVQRNVKRTKRPQAPLHTNTGEERETQVAQLPSRQPDKQRTQTSISLSPISTTYLLGRVAF
jgi:hypothetical protein